MPIRVNLKDVLPRNHRAALYAAVSILTDELFDDLAAILGGQTSVSDSELADYLPPKYLPRYTPLFAKRFVACVLTVGWKLRSPEYHELACVGEELALAAIIERAEAVLELRGEAADFGAFEDAAFEDTDWKILFRPALDGIEETAVGEVLALTDLRFEKWFVPFRETETVHPYVEADERAWEASVEASLAVDPQDEDSADRMDGAC